MTRLSHYQHSLNTKYYAVLLHRNGNPTISLCKLYGKLRTERDYSRHACTLFRIVRKLKYKVNTEHHSKYIPRKYDTPTNIGMKWQMDVKVIQNNVTLVKFLTNFTNTL